MRKPDREELQYYVVELGIEGAKELFKLSEKQFDKLFYPQVLGGESDRWTFTEPKEYSEWEPVLTEDTIQLARVISENYKVLRKSKVNNKLTINSRSLSQEDIFHNTLISLFKNGSSFKYISDEDTIHLINRAFKTDKIDAHRDSIVSNHRNTEAMVDFTDYYEADDYIENVVYLNQLTPKQKEVANYWVEGLDTTEIALKIGKSKSTVYRIKDEIRAILQINNK